MLETINNLPLIIQILSTFGLILVAAILAILVSNLTTWISEKIKEFRYYLIRKHRFDKPPLAKCYCRDCEEWHPSEHDPSEGKCWNRVGGVTADCWFCWEATPRRKE